MWPTQGRAGRTRVNQEWLRATFGSVGFKTLRSGSSQQRMRPHQETHRSSRVIIGITTNWHKRSSFLTLAFNLCLCLLAFFWSLNRRYGESIDEWNSSKKQTSSNKQFGCRSTFSYAWSSNQQGHTRLSRLWGQSSYSDSGTSSGWKKKTPWRVLRRRIVIIVVRLFL